MDRVFLGAVVVGLIIALRLVMIDNPALGAVVSTGSVLLFLILGGVCALKRARVGQRARIEAMPDPDGPYQGWDPEVIEGGKRRSNGIE